MAVLVITLLLALAVTAKGLHLRFTERRLAARQVPVAARVTNQGTTYEVRALASSDSSGGDVTGRAGAGEAGTLHGPRYENVYTGTWEYTLAGRTHQGLHESNGPVFRAEDMPPATVTVYYDRDNPGQSRLYPGADGSMARAWFIFAGVILAVGGTIVAIGGL